MHSGKNRQLLPICKGKCNKAHADTVSSKSYAIILQGPIIMCSCISWDKPLVKFITSSMKEYPQNSQKYNSNCCMWDFNVNFKLKVPVTKMRICNSIASFKPGGSEQVFPPTKAHQLINRKLQKIDFYCKIVDLYCK